VTESDWLTSTDPQMMLSFLRDRGPVSERKLRLFAVAVASEVRHLMGDGRSRDALRVAERVADGLALDKWAWARGVAEAAYVAAEAWYTATVNESTYADSDEVITAGWRWLVPLDAAAAARATLYRPAETAAQEAVRSMLDVEEWVRQVSRWEAGEGRSPNNTPGPGSRPRLAALLRDIFGNPFSPLVFDSSWSTESIVALSREIYEARAWDRMSVLADALEDAGADLSVVQHCREPGVHVKGCHIIDAILNLV